MTRTLPALVLVIVFFGVGTHGCGCSETSITGHLEPEGACDPATEFGVCNAMEQCGCPTDYFCRFDWSHTFEYCVGPDISDFLEGCAAIGESCGTRDGCLPGAACYPQIEGSDDDRWCHKLCLSNADCTDVGGRCRLEFRDPPEGFGPSPYKLCTFP